MSIWTKIGGSLSGFLEKKVDNAKITSISDNAQFSIAIKETALYIAISYIANTLSKCKFKVYENGKEVENDFYYTLNVSPNPNQNSSQFINAIVENYFYDGHALVIQNPLYPNQLYVADSFVLDCTGFREGRFENVVINDEGVNRYFRARDVWYFKLDNKEVKRLIDGVYNDYRYMLSLALQSYKNSSGKKYKLDLDQTKAGDEDFNKTYNEKIVKDIKEFIKSENAVYPQYSGQDLQEFGTQKGYAGKSDSSDIINIRKDIFEVFAQAFKIPVALFNGNMTNIKDIVTVYITFCIDPLADMIGEEITRKYYSINEWKNGSRVKIDTSCINHVDILEIADKVDKLISSGTASIDEVREKLGMDLLNTEFGQKHWMTANYQNAETALKESEREEG